MQLVRYLPEIWYFRWQKNVFRIFRLLDVSAVLVPLQTTTEAYMYQAPVSCMTLHKKALPSVVFCLSEEVMFLDGGYTDEISTCMTWA
jgi:hypothetical protein